MVKLINFIGDEVNFEDYILILPSVSVGNVPQLTADLIIASLPCKKIGTVWHPAIVPLVGGDPYQDSNEDICTACEIYTNTDLKIAVIQLRSAIELKFAKKFFTEISSFVQQQKFSSVLILTSSFDYELHDVTKGKFYYISNSVIDDSKFKDLPPGSQVKKFEPDGDGRYSVHGSGFALKLHESLGSAVNSSVLIKFVSEGDNEFDAFRLLEVVCCFTDRLNQKHFQRIKLPSSWKYVYGSAPPIGIY